MQFNNVENQIYFRAKAIAFALFICLFAGQIVVCAKARRILQDEIAVANTKAGDAAEAAGRLVGTAATEAVLAKGTLTAFKGIAFLGKTESGMRLLQQIGGATQKAKAVIGALEISVGAKAVEIALEGGRMIRLPMAETKRLDEFIDVKKSKPEHKQIIIDEKRSFVSLHGKLLSQSVCGNLF